MKRLQGLTSEGKLGERDVHGGTITISNIGSVGGTYASPVVHPPEVAIVALGRTQMLPRYPPATQAGEPVAPVPTPIMKVSWAADHRIVDGATLALFCKRWQAFVEEPDRMLVHLS